MHKTRTKKSRIRANLPPLGGAHTAKWLTDQHLRDVDG